MSNAQNYWVHNLDPYIFTVSEIPFQKLGTWQGATALGLAIVLGFVLPHFWQKKLEARGADPKVPAIIKSITTFAAIALAIMYGLHLGGIEWGLRWYSTMYLLGFIQVYLLCRHWISKGTIMLTPYLLDSLIAYLIIGMILGARTFFVLVYNFDAYKNHPMDMLKVWEGGLSFHGGIVGVITAMLLFCKRYQIPFFHLADKIVLAVPFGIAMGRIGNFMNGELYGRIIQSDVPWAVIFPTGGPQPRHPSQIYQSLGEGWGLLITLYLLSRRKLPQGVLAACFIFFYALYRFPVEFFREADEQLKYYFNNTFTMGQILSVITMLAAVAVMILCRKNVITGSEAAQKNIDAFLKKRLEIEAKLIS
jgi:phosphatidylglycerol:prolipoprotein diacylglycerol transferase